MGMRKLDVRKQVLAWWVRRQTMVGNRWLAKRLQMGDEGNISKVIRAVSQSKDPSVRRRGPFPGRSADGNHDQL